MDHASPVISKHRLRSCYTSTVKDKKITKTFTHMGYHAVWDAVSKMKTTFDNARPGNGFDQIRTHSGRVAGQVQKKGIAIGG